MPALTAPARPRLRLIARTLCALVVGVILASAPAAGQALPSPLLEAPVEMSRGYGLELVAIRLGVLGQVPDGTPDIGEIVGPMAGSNFQRFGGTLAAIDPDLARALGDALGGIAASARAGEPFHAGLGAAASLLRQAYDALVPPELQATPAYRGAIAAQLLLADGGVADSYGEAAEDFWEYTIGFAAWQRVKEIWAGLAPALPADRRDAAADAIGLIDAFYPGFARPEPFRPRNRDALAGPAEMMIAVFEQAAGAELFSSRDLVALAARLQEVVLDGCAAYAAGNPAVAAEHVRAAFDNFAGESVGTANAINVFAPELGDEMWGLFNSLIGVRREGPRAADPLPPPRPANEACPALAADFGAAVLLFRG